MNTVSLILLILFGTASGGGVIPLLWKCLRRSQCTSTWEDNNGNPQYRCRFGNQSQVASKQNHKEKNSSTNAETKTESNQSGQNQSTENQSSQ